MFKKIKLMYFLIFFSSIDYAKKIGVNIGENCRIATRYFGSEPYLITIGNNVQITNGVKFFTHGGGWVFRLEYPEFDTYGKITIGDNVYIGNDALLLPGIRIGDNTIVAAGSIVTKSFSSGVVIGGNPARVLGKTDELKQRLLPFNLNIHSLSYSEKKNFLLSQNDQVFLKK